MNVKEGRILERDTLTFRFELSDSYFSFELRTVTFRFELSDSYFSVRVETQLLFGSSRGRLLCRRGSCSY